MTPERSAQLLLGPWAIQNEALSRMMDVVRSLDLATFKAEHGGEEEDGDGDDALYKLLPGGIAHIQISGTVTKHVSSFASMFGGASTVIKRKAIRRAVEDPGVYGIVLEFDTPGGTVAGVDDLAQDIRAARDTKPVWGAVSDMCASAGYWLASQCDQLWVNTTGMVGCIGVYTVLEDDTGYYDQYGVKMTLVKTGRYKGLGADGKVTADLVEDVQREIDDINELFIAAVVTGRSATLTVDRVRELADGRVHIGEKAKELGLVDAVGSFDQCVEALKGSVYPMATTISPADYAASNPEAVQSWIQQGYDKAKAELTPKPATVAELEAAFPGEDAFVLTQLKANASLDAAKLAHRDKLTAEVKSLRDENAKLKANGGAGGHVREPVPGGMSAGGTDEVNPLLADAERRAKAAKH
jgi:signal peptide peptidase SppA